jgi:hypothetical protein
MTHRASPRQDGKGSLKGGRPSSYSDVLAEAICAEIANGKCLREICRGDGMPGMTSIFRWLAQHEEFRAMYAAAREAQADYLAEELLEIADDATNDWMQRRREDGTIATVLNGEHVQRSRLRIDTRKFLLAKLQPKRYGAHVTTALTGPDGGAVRVENALGPLSSLDPAELQFLHGILERRAGIKSEDDAEPEEAADGDVEA